MLNTITAYISLIRFFCFAWIIHKLYTRDTYIMDSPIPIPYDDLTNILVAFCLLNLFIILVLDDTSSILQLLCPILSLWIIVMLMPQYIPQGITFTSLVWAPLGAF